VKMSTSAPRTVVVERVIGGMAEVPKPHRAIRSSRWRPAQGGDQRRWGTQAPDHVAVYGGAEHGVCRAGPKKLRVSPRRKIATFVRRWGMQRWPRQVGRL
jgi:hypothetical protein